MYNISTHCSRGIETAHHFTEKMQCIIRFYGTKALPGIVERQSNSKICSSADEIVVIEWKCTRKNINHGIARKVMPGTFLF